MSGSFYDLLLVALALILPPFVFGAVAAVSAWRETDEG